MEYCQGPVKMYLLLPDHEKQKVKHVIGIKKLLQQSIQTEGINLWNNSLYRLHRHYPAWKASFRRMAK
jgi:hypothetical protein